MDSDTKCLTPIGVGAERLEFHTPFKNFNIVEDMVTKYGLTPSIFITHNLKDEFKSDLSYGLDYSLDTFFEENLKSYKLGEKYNMTKIISFEDYTIVSSMPYYKRILNSFDIYEFEKLIKFMSDNKLYHRDFSLENIGIDNNGNYKIANMSGLTTEPYYQVSYDENTKRIELGNNYKILFELKSLNLEV